MAKRALSSTVLGLAALALAALAAGCGGGSGGGASSVAATTGTTTTAAGGAGPNSAAFKAYQACLKSHGVTVSFFGRGRPPGARDGTPPTSTTSGAAAPPPTGSTQRRGFRQLTAKQRKAMAACQSKLPAGAGFTGGGPAGGAGNAGPANAELKKYTACLKSHGVTFGSSSASGKTFAKAAAACKSLLPTSSGR